MGQASDMARSLARYELKSEVQVAMPHCLEGEKATLWIEVGLIEEEKNFLDK